MKQGHRHNTPYSNTSYVAINLRFSVKLKRVIGIQIHRMLLLIDLLNTIILLVMSYSNTSYVAINPASSGATVSNGSEFKYIVCCY